MNLPDWLPLDAWNGYVEMRKKKKAVMTERAVELCIAKLKGFHDDGHDVGAILNQSVANGYTGVFEVRGEDRRSGNRSGGIQALGKKGQATADNAKAWLEGDQSADAIKLAKQKFAALFTGLADYYKDEVSQASLKIYWEGLKHFDYEALEQAAWAHTQLPDESGHWMPRVDSLRRMLEGRTSDQGQIAWSKVDRAVRTVGPYWDVAFDDPIIHRVIADMGGWVQINSSEDKNWPFVAKEFVNRYQSFKMTGQQPEHERYLIGMATAQNQASGIYYDKPNVRLLGNVEKARQIASGKTTVQVGVAQKQLKGCDYFS